MAEQAGIEQVTLGPHILRAETAAIATISILQSRLGQLGYRPPVLSLCRGGQSRVIIGHDGACTKQNQIPMEAMQPIHRPQNPPGTVVAPP
jgi:hypothetical protein